MSNTDPTVDQLRRAAVHVRQLAAAATPGRWWNESGTVHAPIAGRPEAACHPLDAQGANGVSADADAEWTSTLGPQIADTLAQVLDDAADELASGGRITDSVERLAATLLDEAVAS